MKRKRRKNINKANAVRANLHIKRLPIPDGTVYFRTRNIFRQAERYLSDKSECLYLREIDKTCADEQSTKEIHNLNEFIKLVEANMIIERFFGKEGVRQGVKMRTEEVARQLKEQNGKIKKAKR